MKVTLLRYTLDPELLCAAAAMTSSKSEGTTELLKKLNKRRAERIVRRVMNHGHLSVVEHATFTFSVEGVSRALTHQLVRHRIASYTQQSQRYVKYNALKHYVIPESIAQREETKRLYESTLRYVSNVYQKLLDYGIPPEDARFILPNAAKTNIVVTMNARELIHASHLRLCQRAQWEIRELFERIKACVEEVSPLFASYLVPQCEYLGYCPEGSLGCGKMPTKEEVLKGLNPP
ncbi:MAG: FAD-dependent thymidylate synthase [Candidatus Freyarchaeota archaeon]